MTRITKEEPIGTIDGVNKAFQLKNNLLQIDDVWFDGEVYFGNLSYVRSSKTLTLEDAPTTTLFIDYFT